MKQLKLKNSELASIINLLDKINMSKQASRGRSKLRTRLAEKFEDYEADLKHLRLESKVFLMDGGDFVTQGDVLQYDDSTEDFAERKKQLTTDVEELLQEEVVVSFAEYSTKFEAFFKALDVLEMELNGPDAIAYDKLLDAYEQNEEEK